ncbi:MAG: response regulator [Paracoccaceae bacterium]
MSRSVPSFAEKKKGTIRLLAIDDESDYLSFIQVVAEDLGFEVFTLAHSAEFESAFSGFKPDILMVDIMMPDLDGIEIARSLAKSSGPKNIIFMSGFQTDFTKFAKVLANPDGIHSVHSFSKPIHLGPFRELLIRLREESELAESYNL